MSNPRQDVVREASVTSRKHRGSHWSDMARRWEQVGPPLRPVAEDLAICTAVIQGWAETHGAPRALILGVTPELYRLSWPAGSEVSAIDRTQGMIEAIWPGPRSAVICADWTVMPLETSSRDIALCDGGIAIISYPQDHHHLVRALHRVLAPAGLCVLRLYVPPTEREAPEAVLRDLLDGNVPNLNILKLRLGMALQDSSASGVQLRDIWNALHQAAPDFHALAAQVGWPLEHLLAINTYRDCATRYHFLSVAEVCRLFVAGPGGFEFESLYFPTYLLGDRCPTVVFRRHGTAPTSGD